MTPINDRFLRNDDRERATRKIADTQIAIHCHHYNSRFVATIEGAAEIDGAGLVEKCARQAFQPLLAQCRRSADEPEMLLNVAEALYSHLGFGMLDLAQLSDGFATQSVSHIVEGYRAGLHAVTKKACSLSCGYIEAVSSEYFGNDVKVHEIACMLEGARQCSFEIAGERFETDEPASTDRVPPKKSTVTAGDLESHVDSAAIVEALLALDVGGDASGLVQAFDVYLANMPVDFYNLAANTYLERMRALGRGEIAARLLANDAETCGLNTFRGVLQSTEWKNITGDSLRNSTDTLVAFAAVCRSLGWGEYRVTEHVPGKHATFAARGGYEAVGFLEHRGKSVQPSCPMFTGVAAGIVELVEGSGPIIERAGQYAATERMCEACGDECCSVHVEIAE